PLCPSLRYTAKVWPEIAHTIDDVDRAMRWGFGWELGPFEIMDAIGPHEALDGVFPPGRQRCRDNGLPPTTPDLRILKAAKDRDRVDRRRPHSRRRRHQGDARSRSRPSAVDQRRRAPLRPAGL